MHEYLFFLKIAWKHFFFLFYLYYVLLIFKKLHFSEYINITNSQVLVGIRAPEQNSHNSIQVGVIVPEALVQYKQIPIGQREQSAGDLELVAQGDAKGPEPHEPVDDDHPGQAQGTQAVHQGKVADSGVAPLDVHYRQSAFLRHVQQHAQS